MIAAGWNNLRSHVALTQSALEGKLRHIIISIIIYYFILIKTSEKGDRTKYKQYEALLHGVDSINKPQWNLLLISC